MRHTQSLQKEKEILLSRISICRNYIRALRGYETVLDEKLSAGQITSEQYMSQLGFGQGNKSFEDYHLMYTEYLERCNERLRIIDGKLARHEANSRLAKTAVPVLMMVIMALLLIGLNDPSITGNLVFSLNRGTNMTQDLIFNASSNYSIAPPTAGSLTSLKLSGEYAGKGRLVIYLDTGNNSYLVLAKENATRFESECGGACTLNENADNYTLRISMPESGVLRLRSITPIVSHLQEFTLEPANRTFKASPGGDISGSINIENKMGERLALAIYGEGNLTPYLTLNASYLLLDQGTAANIAYSIDLPESMKEGLYTEKIIVRYLPGETFTGAVPIEAHMINVIVPSPLSETRIGKNYLPPLLLIVFIILLLIPIFSQARKMILRRRLQNNAAQSNANNDSRGY